MLRRRPISRGSSSVAQRLLAGPAAALALTLGAACAPAAAPEPLAPGPQAQPAARTEGELVLYSARKEDLMQPVIDLFQEKTGVKVTVKSGAPGELALLIEQEKSSPRGDVYFTTDVATAESLRLKALLEPYKSPSAATIPDEFKATDGAWTGVIGRARTIMYNTRLLTPEQAPKSVFELTDARWKDKVAVASIREGGVRLWLASLILQNGEDFAVKYVNDLKNNGVKVLANHTEGRKAVGRGEVPVGLTNHYYYVFEKKDGSPVDQVYPDQGPNDVGTLVTPLVVAIMKGAQHPQAARAFVDFVLTPEGVQPMTTQEAEFPLVPGASLGDAGVPGVKPIDQIKRPSVDVTALAAAQQRAVELFTPVLGGP